MAPRIAIARPTLLGGRERPPENRNGLYEVLGGSSLRGVDRKMNQREAACHSVICFTIIV